MWNKMVVVFDIIPPHVFNMQTENGTSVTPSLFLLQSFIQTSIIAYFLQNEK